MAKREARVAASLTAIIFCLLILTGCSTQEDMGISLEKYVQGYNHFAAENGAGAISLDDYIKNDGEDSGHLLVTLPQGTEYYIAVTGKGNVASIQLFIRPEGINGDTLLEMKSTAISCIRTLDKNLYTDITSLTGLDDMTTSAKALQENTEAYFLYFFDTNSKGLDAVHGKQYRLWYNNGLKYTILYPLQG